MPIANFFGEKFGYRSPQISSMPLVHIEPERYESNPPQYVAVDDAGKRHMLRDAQLWERLEAQRFAGGDWSPSLLAQVRPAAADCTGFREYLKSCATRRTRSRRALGPATARAATSPGRARCCPACRRGCRRSR